MLATNNLALYATYSGGLGEIHDLLLLLLCKLVKI